MLITGSRRGLGLALSRRLAADGWSVYAGRRGLHGNRLPLPGTPESALRELDLDLLDPGSIDEARTRLESELAGRGLFALVNNAAISRLGSVEQMPLEHWRRILETNLLGQIAVTQAFLPLLRAHPEGGRILFVGSLSAHIRQPYQAAYAASKAALAVVVETLRLELGPDGPSVLLVEPGSLRTEMSRGIEINPCERDVDSRHTDALHRQRAWIRRAAATAPTAEAVAGVLAEILAMEQPPARCVIEARPLRGRLSRLVDTCRRAISTSYRRVLPAAESHPSPATNPQSTVDDLEPGGRT